MHAAGFRCTAQCCPRLIATMFNRPVDLSSVPSAIFPFWWSVYYSLRIAVGLMGISLI